MLFHLRLRRLLTVAEPRQRVYTLPSLHTHKHTALRESNTTLLRNHTGTNGLFSTYGEHSRCALLKRSFANKSIGLPTNSDVVQNDP